jgi:hypothetical protein
MPVEQTSTSSHAASDFICRQVAHALRVGQSLAAPVQQLALPRLAHNGAMLRVR